MFLLFIHIPKCAGEFIQKKFNFYQNWKNSNVYKNEYFQEKFNNDQNFTFGHADINIFKKKNVISKKFYDKSFKFCIVRNPYSRFVSIFLYYKKHNILNKNYSFDNYINYVYNNKNNIPKNNSQNVNYKIYNLRSHLNQQKSWIPNDINKIYKFEDGLEKICLDIVKHTNAKLIDNNFSKVNYTIKKKKYYNNNNFEKIYEIYKNDFLSFNYSKNSYKYF